MGGDLWRRSTGEPAERPRGCQRPARSLQVFIELPAFERHRYDYLDDDGFAQLQLELMVNPIAGDLIEGTGGLRKLRFKDSRRSKGKRGGLRVIFYYWTGGPEFWLFTLYDG
jgi:hypothetical protein